MNIRNVEVVIRNDATFRAVIEGPDGPFEPTPQPTDGSTPDIRHDSEEMRELQAAILAAYKKPRGEADGV
jgi:hypothetical protein